MTHQSVDRRTVLKTSAAVGRRRPVRRPARRARRRAQATPRGARWCRSPTRVTARCGCTCPQGFCYRSFHDTEQPVTLNDGTVLPGRHDGMGAFKGPDGTVMLVRNHEVNDPGARRSAPGRRTTPGPAVAPPPSRCTRTGR